MGESVVNALILQKIGVSVTRRYNVGIPSVLMCWFCGNAGDEGTVRGVLREGPSGAARAGVGSHPGVGFTRPLRIGIQSRRILAA
jgi:hypothetical protein